MGLSCVICGSPLMHMDDECSECEGGVVTGVTITEDSKYHTQTETVCEAAGRIVCLSENLARLVENLPIGMLQSEDDLNRIRMSLGRNKLEIDEHFEEAEKLIPPCA